MNVTRRLPWLVLAALVLAAGCRIERSPASSPFDFDAGAPEVDAPRGPKPSGGAPAMDAPPASAAGAGAGAGVSAPAGSGRDGGAGSSGLGASAGAGGATGTAVDPFDADASAAGDPGDRCEPKVLECNPVSNEGCPPAMQCAIDPLSSALAGYCIFSSTPMPAGCFNSGVTESCPPTETCFEFECRKLCFCDDDCKEGQCCVDPVGSLGFKVCGEC